MTAEQTARVEATWHGVPDADQEALSGTALDQWRVVSDEGRIGLEHHREFDGGFSRVRTVHLESHHRIFTFDPAMLADSPIVGQLSVRYQSLRVDHWRSPVFDYLDTLFSMQGRYSRGFLSLNHVADNVMVDGHSCHEVQGDWNGREFTLWLDAAFGYLPRKYILRADVLSEMDFGSRGGPEISYPRLLEAPTQGEERGRPRTREERLVSVQLEKLEGRPYVAKAIIERSMFFSRDVSYTERIQFETDSIQLATAPDAESFIEMEGLLGDGTPVEVRRGDPNMVEHSVRQFVMDGGELVPAGASFSGYMSELSADLSRLAADFSVENFKQVDIKFFVAVCAVAALLINGGMAYFSHRRKKAGSTENNGLGGVE